MIDNRAKKGLKVFYSYSHKDEDLRRELEKHLTLLQRQGVIRSWHDRKISPGLDWKGAIDANLASADIVLLLVSADFMASDYCFDVEMRWALERQQEGEMTVIPILCRPVEWIGAPFSHLQTLPQDARAITLWPNMDEAFTDVTRGIRQAILDHIANQEVILSPPSDGIPALGHAAQNQTALPRTLPLTGHVDVVAIETILLSLADRWSASIIKLDLEGPLPYFELDLHNLCLRGTDKPIPALALWREDLDFARALNELARKALTSFSLVLCLTWKTHEAVTKDSGARGAWCILSPANLNQLIATADPVRLLLKIIVGQVGRRRISPYSVVHPARGSMFFGRSAEIEQLTEDRDTSYAIVGPSLVGKSSLMQQYVWLTRRNRLPDPWRLFYINMFGCIDPRESLRFIAMHIEPSSRSYRVKENDFLPFLRYQNRLHGPLELLLDEVDTVCSSPAFEFLGHAAKEGLVRLILGGRGELIRFATDPKSRFSLRIQILRPTTLGLDAARDALVRPMRDLGIAYQDGACVDHICRMTGGLPFLLQYYGQALVAKIETTGGTETVSRDIIGDFENQFDTIHFMMRPISEIDNPELKSLALTLLKSHKSSFTAAEISDLILRDGERAGASYIFDSCNALCLHGVLVYEGGSFKVANLALRDLALRSGYLDLLI